MENITKIRREARIKRHRRIRKKVFGTSQRPRLAVYRSLNNIYGQLIDDEKGITLFQISTLTPSLKNEVKDKMSKTEKSKLVGKVLGQLATEKGIEEVIFDRAGYLYHGRIKALADGAREGGLKF